MSTTTAPQRPPNDARNPPQQPQPSLDALLRRLVTASPEELAAIRQTLDGGGENLRLLSVIETAKRLRLSTWTVYALMRQGALEYIKPRHGFCKIPERVVDAYITTNLIKGGDIGMS